MLGVKILSMHAVTVNVAKELVSARIIKDRAGGKKHGLDM